MPWGDEPGSSDAEVFALKVSDIKTGGIIQYETATSRSISNKDFDRNTLVDGDIVVVKSSGSSERVVSGKCAVFRNPDGRRYVPVNFLLTIRANHNQIEPALLYRYLSSPRAREHVLSIVAGSTYPNLTKDRYLEFEIPLPPLEVQQEIVAEIEGYQKVIDGARAVLDHYRPHIPIHPDWPKRELGTLAENLDSRRVPITKDVRKAGPFPYYGASGIVDSVADFIFDEDILLISEDGANLLARSTPIAFSVSGKCWVNNHAHVLRFEQPATQKFVEVHLNSISIAEFVTGSAQPKLNQQALNSIPIPIPDDVATQQQIVSEIETEQRLVAANRELIERFEQKIAATLARIWGD